MIYLCNTVTLICVNVTLLCWFSNAKNRLVNESLIFALMLFQDIHLDV